MYTDACKKTKGKTTPFILLTKGQVGGSRGSLSKKACGGAKGGEGFPPSFQGSVLTFDIDTLTLTCNSLNTFSLKVGKLLDTH